MKIQRLYSRTVRHTIGLKKDQERAITRRSSSICLGRAFKRPRSFMKSARPRQKFAWATGPVPKLGHSALSPRRALYRKYSSGDIRPRPRARSGSRSAPDVLGCDVRPRAAYVPDLENEPDPHLPGISRIVPPWEPVPGEPDDAHQAFALYLDTDRTITAHAEALGTSLSRIQALAARWRWRA